MEATPPEIEVVSLPPTGKQQGSGTPVLIEAEEPSGAPAHYPRVKKARHPRGAKQGRRVRRSSVI